jgi:hypothetical protein
MTGPAPAPAQPAAGGAPTVASVAGAAAVPPVAGPPPAAPAPSDQPEGDSPSGDASSAQGQVEQKQSQDFDPTKSPSEQIDQVGGQPTDPKQQDASKVTKLPIKGLSGPLPAVILGVIILIFVVTLALYAFLG